jgi:hypothetical protein
MMTLVLILIHEEQRQLNRHKIAAWLKKPSWLEMAGIVRGKEGNRSTHIMSLHTSFATIEWDHFSRPKIVKIDVEGSESNDDNLFA